MTILSAGPRGGKIVPLPDAAPCFRAPLHSGATRRAGGAVVAYNRPIMNLDDNICYCYHVSLRKLVNYARREQPRRASQMSQCLGAGTGCGWCIPILKKIFEESRRERQEAAPIAGLSQTPEDYAAGRQAYLRSAEKNRFETEPLA